MFQSCSELACSLTLDAVPGDLNRHVYLNIEMAIVRLQWVSFAVMPSRTLKPLSVLTLGGMSDVFCHSVAGRRLGCQAPCCSFLGCMLSIYCIVWVMLWMLLGEREMEDC